MTTLYSQALQHHARQHLATLTALDRQQEQFALIDTLADEINRETALQAEPCFQPPAGAFIRLRLPLADAAQLASVCRRHQLALVPNGSGWLLVSADHGRNQTAILLLAH